MFCFFFNFLRQFSSFFPLELNFRQRRITHFGPDFLCETKVFSKFCHFLDVLSNKLQIFRISMYQNAYQEHFNEEKIPLEEENFFHISGGSPLQQKCGNSGRSLEVNLHVFFVFC